MKILLMLVVAFIVIGSIVADYLWRRWMTARRMERDTQDRDLRQG